MYLVWSPESNFVLYGETAKVIEAIEEGVTVSLAPDWTITGSDNVLAEMKVAWNFSQTQLGGKVTPRQLFQMVTVNAAKVAGVDRFLGKIAPKHAADFFLAPKLMNDPYLSLLKTRPRDIHLVFVDGLPIYGACDEMKELVSSKAIDEAAIDQIEVEGIKKGVITLGDPLTALHYGQHYQDIENTLKNALPKLAPLIED
jgi:hypothetical protein